MEPLAPAEQAEEDFNLQPEPAVVEPQNVDEDDDLKQPEQPSPQDSDAPPAAEEEDADDEDEEELQARLLKLLGDRLDPEEDRGGAVCPIDTCPHLKVYVAAPASWPVAKQILESPCSEPGCSDPRKENWVCCACYWVGCSRYVEEHMALHAVVQGHMIAMSLGDMYIWCYGCDAYVGGERAEQFRRPISMLKQYGPRLQQMLHQKMAEQGLEPGDLQQKPEEPEDPPAAPDQSS